MSNNIAYNPPIAQAVNDKTSKNKERGRPSKLGAVDFYLYNFLKGNKRKRDGKTLTGCPRFSEPVLAKIVSRIMQEEVTRSMVRSSKARMVRCGLIEIKKNKNVRWGHQDRIIKLRGGDHKLSWQEVFCPTLLQRHEQKKAAAEAEEKRKRAEEFHIDNLILCGGDSERAIEAFKSVGVPRLEFFFRPLMGHTTKARIRNMAELLAFNKTEQTNLFGRAYDVPVIMIDEVKLPELKQLRPFALMAVETSANNYLVWLRMPDGTSDVQRKFFRERLLDKLNPTGDPARANGGSYGSMRWPDSLNWKAERNQFRVRIAFVNSGRLVTGDELEAAGMLAPAPMIETKKVVPLKRHNKSRFPNYEFCLIKKNGQRSLADAEWIWISSMRGFTSDEIRQEIPKVSAKVVEEREARGNDSYLEHQIRFVLAKIEAGEDVADAA